MPHAEKEQHVRDESRIQDSQPLLHQTNPALKDHHYLSLQKFKFQVFYFFF